MFNTFDIFKGGGGNILKQELYVTFFALHMGRRISHITNLLSQSLGRSWTVSDMADEINMSTPHFQKRFKQETGFTPKAYFNDLRLEKSREFLEDANCFLQIKEIGHQVGFADISNFTREFKRKFGMTPTQYRQDHWKNGHSSPPDEQK